MGEPRFIEEKAISLDRAIFRLAGTLHILRGVFLAPTHYMYDTDIRVRVFVDIWCPGKTNYGRTIERA